MVTVHGEDAVNAGGSPAGSSDDVSSVTRIGTVQVVVRDSQTHPTGPRRPGYQSSPPQQH